MGNAIESALAMPEKAVEMIRERDAEIERLRAQVAELESALLKQEVQQAAMWRVIRDMAGTYHKIRADVDMKFTAAMMELDKLRD